jgi:hypothetical protein
MNKIWFAVAGATLAGGIGLWIVNAQDAPEESGADPARLAAPGESPIPGRAIAPPRGLPAPDPAVRDRVPPSREENGEKPDEDGDEDEDAVDAAGIKLSVMNATRGLDRPRRTPGEAATAAAMEEPDMSELDVTDPGYDEVVETHQLFHDFETDVLGRGPITPEVWAELQETHAPAKQAMLDRSVELARAGKANESESMLLEWIALESGYQEQVE